MRIGALCSERANGRPHAAAAAQAEEPTFVKHLDGLIMFGR